MKNIAKIKISDKFIKIININPLVLYTQHHFFRDYTLGTFTIPSIFKNKCYLISASNWYWNDIKYRPGQYQLVIEGYEKFITEYPNVVVIFMHPDEDERNGWPNIPSIIFNRNALIDVNKFYPIETNLEYDAIYNAVLYKYKRHELAFDINNLAIIYYLRNNTNKIYYISNEEMNYGHELHQKLQNMNNIALINDSFGQYRFLNNHEISNHYSKAKCGLCLSDIEGACLTSVEYLLTGIPVISTENHGGRNGILKECDFAYFVKDNAADIAACVDNLKTFDKNKVRENVVHLIDKQWNLCEKQLKKLIKIQNFYEFKRNFIAAQSQYKI